MKANDKSKEKLLRELEGYITKLFEQALDYAQVACPTQDTYKVLRSKILRVGNNCIRNVRKRLKHYDVEFVPQTEEVIEVIRKSTKK
ncbi:MAG: hypothetical protein DRO67_03545 [Candidatus Asgardarchaeum californiense]|nr:MAG: hypothetical protein DRO67_03545 [Candidatus Asgardarchaeum californiense]